MYLRYDRKPAPSYYSNSRGSDWSQASLGMERSTGRASPGGGEVLAPSFSKHDQSLDLLLPSTLQWRSAITATREHTTFINFLLRARSSTPISYSSRSTSCCPTGADNWPSYAARSLHECISGWSSGTVSSVSTIICRYARGDLLRSRLGR